MKSILIPEYQAFVRYFDIVGDEETIYVYLGGLSTSAILSLLDIATHPKIRGKRSLLIDYLGSGFSDIPTDFDHSVEHHAQNIAAVLDAEGLKECTVIGHSMGGTVGAYLAIERPDLVGKLIMAEANLESGGGPGTRSITSNDESEWLNSEYANWVNKMRQPAVNGDAVAGMWLTMLQTADPYGIYHSAKGMVDLPQDYTDALYALTIPRTFIYGAKNLPENNDGEIWPDSPEPQTLISRGFRVGIVENSGHAMMVDNLDGFADVIAEALAE
jgi:pimeloyl-ACP methyl ester carboxylesterase